MAIKINNTTIIDNDRNIVNAGVITATTFVGSGSGLTNVSGVSTQTNINTSGIVTASSFVGNLTGNAAVGVLTATTISAGSTTGTSGQYLQSTGTGLAWSNVSGGLSITDSNVIGYNSAGIRSDIANGRLEVFGTGNFTVFRTPGTFVVNPGISSVRVRTVGAGGNGTSGGSGSFPPNIIGQVGSGGGGGGYAHKVITSFPAPRSYAVTVGTSPGGTSSFGSEVSATGGTAGSGPRVGGTGSGGDVNFTGATGGPGGPPSSPGVGGASATQLGNASGSSVPGISPSIPSNGYSIKRFPFDIFEGLSGFVGGSSVASDGSGGARGSSGGPSGTPGGAGGAGGIGGGGAGGGGGAPGDGIFPPGSGGAGGAGGSGLVIVEW